MGVPWPLIGLNKILQIVQQIPLTCWNKKKYITEERELFAFTAAGSCLNLKGLGDGRLEPWAGKGRKTCLGPGSSGSWPSLVN